MLSETKHTIERTKKQRPYGKRMMEELLRMSRDARPKWIGSFRRPVPRGQKKKTQRVYLGYVSEVSEEEARRQLRIEMGLAQDRALAHEKLACISTNFKRPKSDAGQRVLRYGEYGRIAELFVCADLLAKGFAVFSAESPQCICDLVYFDGDRFVRVEVKSASVMKNGRVQVSRLYRNAGNFDVLAIYVQKTGEIHYIQRDKIQKAAYPLEQNDSVRQGSIQEAK